MNNRFKCKVDFLIYNQSYEDLQHLEYSNKIILNSLILDQLIKLDDNILSNKMHFKLINETEFGIFEGYVGVHDFSANDNKIFISNKIANNLFIEQYSDIYIEYCSPPKGTFLKIEPLSDKFYNILDIKSFLENNIQYNYPIIEENSILSIKNNTEIIDLKILECKPYEIITTDNTDIEVEFAPMANNNLTKNENTNILSMDKENINSEGKNNNPEFKFPQLINKEDDNDTESNKEFVPFSGKGYTLGTN